jgi:predicted dehydrogenase
MADKRIGLVDFGGWFYPPVYAEALAAVDGIDFAAGTFLVDDATMAMCTYGATRQTFVEKFGLTIYDDIATMIETEKLDAVAMFGAYGHKADRIVEAAACGVDIFVTKPPAATLEQMQRIVDAAKTNNVSITVPEHTRYNAVFADIHARVQAGAIGDLISARVLHQHGHLTPEVVSTDHWYALPQHGGPEVSLGWYCAGLLRWFVGSEPVRVFAEYDNYKTPHLPHMDNGKGTVRFESGVIGSMDILFSNSVPYPSTVLELIGQAGNITVRTNEQHVTEFWIYTDSGVETGSSQQPDSIPGEMQAWVGSLVDSTRAEMPAEEAMGILELCLAWAESAKRHEPVMLPL